MMRAISMYVAPAVKICKCFWGSIRLEAIFRMVAASIGKQWHMGLPFFEDVVV